MMSRKPNASKTATEWVVRGLLAAIVAVAGLYGFSFTFAQVVAKNGNPALAYRLMPGDAQIAALLSAQLSGAKASPGDRRRADALARAALRRDAAAVKAVSTLGINAQIRGDTAAARRLFAYAEFLSRRDLQTQLWAIEDAVSREDIPSALRHYDIALRTSRMSKRLLFPVLASAVADPAIRAPLVRTLARHPAWGEEFIDFVASSGPDPRAGALLFSSLGRVNVEVPESARAGIINALVATGATDEAWTYYAAIRPGVLRLGSRDPRFSLALDTPSIFDWVPVSDNGVNTSIQRSANGGLVDFYAPSSVGGPLLKQLQLLPPGDYRLEGQSKGIDQVSGSRPYWTLKCANDVELGRVDLPNSSQAHGAFSGRFRVPPGCPVQTLMLVARPSDAVSGLAGQIFRAQLMAVR